MRASWTKMQRLVITVVLMLTAISLPGAGSVTAQATFECDPPAAAAPATPAGEPVTATASEIAFPDDGKLTVFAAASLTDAFGQIGDDIMAAHPDIEISFNFAGSQALATQLAQGAPADVFASANDTQMQAAIDAGVVTGEPHAFTRNRLAIVVPADNPANIETPADLTQDGVKLVLAQPEVPVGRYARTAICAMGQDTATYGDGFVEQVGENIVSQEEDVRAVLAKVQLGEADAGIVYVSDITDDVAGDVQIIEIPEPVNVIASYPIATVDDGDTALAHAFIAYVLGPEGQATLEEYGFTPLG